MHLKTLAFSALLAAALSVTSSFAQGTAFTYQGRLADTNGPANGDYDFRFRIFDSVTDGTPVGGFTVAAPVAVSNGLFTVVIDPGAGIFTGPARWMEIGIRTNGSFSGYTTLQPRQQLTAAPYAIHAAIAAGVPAGTITSSMLATGAVGVAQLADGSITADKLAANSVGAAQLSRRYLSGSVAYSNLSGVSFSTALLDKQVTFAPPFNLTPVVTLTIDTPHPALPAKGSPLITERTTNGFTMRIPAASVGVEIARAGTGSTLRPTIQTVNGNPAVIGAGQVGLSVGIVYSRSTDTLGQNWASPVMIQPGYFLNATLEIVDGKPAIFYADYSGGVSLIRSGDANGTTWGTPVQVLNPGVTGSVERMDTIMVSGNPAIVVSSSTNVYYVRSGDVAGTTWADPAKVFSTIYYINSLDAAVIGGQAAISVLAGQSISYARANDIVGGSWPAPTVAVADPNPGSPWSGPFGSLSLVELSGRPFIGYVWTDGINHTTAQVHYTRGVDSAGSSWSAPEAVAVLSSDVVIPVLSMVGSTPAMAYANGQLNFHQSTAIGPSLVFGSPQVIEPASAACGLATIASQPAIAFYGNGSLRYVRNGNPPPNSTVNWIAIEP